MSLLITFKSKAAAEFIMYKSHVKPILELLGKDTEKGVLTPAELSGAIAKIEANIAASKEGELAKHSDVRRTDHDAAQDEDQDEEVRRKQNAQVSVSTRLFPLLDMLRAANQQQRDVVWGV